MSVGKGSLKRAVSAKTTAEESVKTAKSEIVDVEIEKIEYTSKQNKRMDASIAKYGVIVPVVLVKEKDVLKAVDGNKRITTLKKLGEKTVKAVVLQCEASKIKSELNKFGDVQTKDDIHEKKFEVIKRLGEEEMPFYLL